MGKINNGIQTPEQNAAQRMITKVLQGMEPVVRQRGIQFYDTDGDGEPELVIMHADAVPDDVEDFVHKKRKEASGGETP